MNASQQMYDFLQIFANHAESLSNRNLPTYILSDSNIDLLKLSHNENSKDFLDICSCYGFLPLISKATRFQGLNCSAIDHIFTNKAQANYTSGVITDQLSDHMYTFTEIESLKPKNPPSPRYIQKRLINKDNILSFNIALSNQTWIDVENAESADAAYHNFSSIFFQLYELFFPLISIKINKKFSPRNGFMTAGLMISRNRKLELARLCKNYPTIYNINLYKSYRNLFNTLVRKSKEKFYCEKLERFKKKPKKLWDVIKEVTNSKTKNPKQMNWK